jgi:hypothetical protein
VSIPTLSLKQRRFWSAQDPNQAVCNLLMSLDTAAS